MSKPTDFIAWVTDSQRTNDELFTVELLVERMRAWQHWPFRDRSLGFEEQQKVRKERRFNPAYRPLLPLDELTALQEGADTVTHFGASGLSDRPLRDLTALGFFPAMENINITQVAVKDFSPLAVMPKLNWLTLMEGTELGGAHRYDFADLGPKPALDHVFLSLRQAWPDLTAMATWTVLRDLTYHGNLLAFSSIETLPAVQIANVQKGVGASTPLRDLRVFPTMPAVKVLTIAPSSSLEGIERYPSVVNLDLGGDFTDLAPLAALENVTFLKLTSEHFTDLTPLTRMPRLREIVLVRERPLDLSPLTDAPHLRRVDFERCATMRTELAALNAGLLPEADDFLAETPRPLGPLPFYFLPKGDEAARDSQTERYNQVTEMRAAFYQGDAAFERAEARSFLSQVFAELNGLLGYRWGYLEIHSASTAGRTMLGFKRYQDTARIREIIQLLRELSARSRFPWIFDLHVAPHGDLSYEMEQLQELEEKAKQPEGHWLAKYFDPESVLRENEEDERRNREKYELLEREHLYKLQQQQGDELDPGYALPLDEDEDKDEDEMEEPSSQPTNDDDEGEGGVAVAPPPPAPPDTEDLSDQLCYYLTLTEDALYVGEHWADRARYGLGESPVPWTDPGPARKPGS